MQRVLQKLSFSIVFCTLAFSSASADSCERIQGIWVTNYTGAISGQGYISFSDDGFGGTSVTLDLSQESQQRIIQGQAECLDDKVVIQVGGLADPVFDLKVIGGTLVSTLDHAPLDAPFGAWQMHVIDLKDFADLQLKGFWRMIPNVVEGQTSEED